METWWVYRSAVAEARAVYAKAEAEARARLSDSSLRILETMEKHDNTRIEEDE